MPGGSSAWWFGNSRPRPPQPRRVPFGAAGFLPGPLSACGLLAPCDDGPWMVSGIASLHGWNITGHPSASVFGPRPRPEPICWPPSPPGSRIGGPAAHWQWPATYPPTGYSPAGRLWAPRLARLAGGRIPGRNGLVLPLAFVSSMYSLRFLYVSTIDNYASAARTLQERGRPTHLALMCRLTRVSGISHIGGIPNALCIPNAPAARRDRPTLGTSPWKGGRPCGRPPPLPPASGQWALGRSPGHPPSGAAPPGPVACNPSSGSASLLAAPRPPTGLFGHWAPSRSLPRSPHACALPPRCVPAGTWLELDPGLVPWLTCALAFGVVTAARYAPASHATRRTCR